jgi:hypothetical protein
MKIVWSEMGKGRIWRKSNTRTGINRHCCTLQIHAATVNRSFWICSLSYCCHSHGFCLSSDYADLTHSLILFPGSYSALPLSPRCASLSVSPPLPLDPLTFPELFKHTSEENPSTDRKILYLAISSDSGLCGGIHSGISKYIKRAQAENPGSIAIVGEKSKAQLSRSLPQQIQVTFSGVGKDVPTFAEASTIADEIVKNAGSWDEVSVVCRAVP